MFWLIMAKDLRPSALQVADWCWIAVGTRYGRPSLDIFATSGICLIKYSSIATDRLSREPNPQGKSL